MSQMYGILYKIWHSKLILFVKTSASAAFNNKSSVLFPFKNFTYSSIYISNLLSQQFDITFTWIRHRAPIESPLIE